MIESNMSVFKNVFLVVAFTIVVILIAIIIHLGKHNSRLETTLTKHNSSAPKSEPPVILELFPDRQVNIVKGTANVLYTQRDFSKLQRGLSDCFQLNPRCSVEKTNDSTCPFLAFILNVELCMDQQKRVVYAQVRHIFLHREDLLQIYEL